MAKGISLHVGVDITEAPEVGVAALEGSENDATAMRDLANARGFITQLLLGQAATFNKVEEEIKKAAQQLVAGDIFLFTFSGHGTRRGANDRAETDMKDETIVLSDKLMVDNVLRRKLWPKFQAGVRVVMVSDSCHSGTVFMAPPPLIPPGGNNGVAAVAVSSVADSGMYRMVDPKTQGGKRPVKKQFGIRAIPDAMAELHFASLSSFYDEVRASLPAGEQAPEIPARVLLLGACNDDETTLDGSPNGVYTQALLDVWRTNGSKTYTELWNGIKAELTGQNPAKMSVGQSPAFDDTEAFKI